MEARYVNVSDLRLGKTVAEDIFANTQFPIIFKNTKLTHDHMQVFKAFNISSVLVYKDSITNEDEEDNGNAMFSNTSQSNIFNFEHQYDEAIQYVKKEFTNWQAGARIDLTKIRGYMIPLIEVVLENRAYIFDLNSYSNPKDYIYHHCIATGLISGIITQKLGFERGICMQMAIAGTLADCGMAKIPARIREKKSSLTEQEFLEVRKHPIYSYQMVKDLPALKTDMKLAVYQHHERLNGSGYPAGTKDYKISIFSQIIAVADVFHAMTSERLYRTKQSTFKVIEMIKESEFGKFDIKVVQALSDIVADLPIGTHVELSNFEQGEVMFINPYAPTRPLVKLFSSGEIIDLSTVRSFYISRIMTNNY
jgi:HD-GYP domain-containing protein (c-di-GMP phosphodiesterase class II)